MNNSSLVNPVAGATGVFIALAAALVAALAVVFVFGAKEAEAQEQTITIDPTTVGFGAVEVGTTGDPVRTITIRNTGNTSVLLGGATLGGTNVGDFSLINPIPVGGITLGVPDPTDPTSGTYELQVSFTPTVNGTRVADLSFIATDSDGNPLTLPTVDVTGIGVTGPPTPPAADCTIIGTDEGEVLTGTPANDVICAKGGNDTADGLAGNDKVLGGNGSDTLVGKGGNDKLYGQGGKDVLNARDGVKRNDRLQGGGGRDKCVKDRRDIAKSC